MRTGIVIAHLLTDLAQLASDQRVCNEEAGSFARFFYLRADPDSAADLHRLLNLKGRSPGRVNQAIRFPGEERPGTGTAVAMDAHAIAEEAGRLVEPVLEDMGFELVDAEYLSKGGRWVLQLFIDKEGGVTIDDCASVSREIGDLIDVRDLIHHEYVLEVSSPGLDRPLKKLKDFRWATGRTVKVRTTRPKDGRRNFTGRLERVEEEAITLVVDGCEVSLPLEELERANLVYEF